jgi:hypothetical protein
MKFSSNYRGRQVGTVFDRCDIFAHPIVSYNLEGHKKIGTSIGCIFSLLFATVVTAYLVVKGRICFLKLNPLVTTTILEN